MNRENWLLVTVEPVEVQDFRKKEKKLPVILEELREFISDNKEKTERCQHVTSWTWKD